MADSAETPATPEIRLSPDGKRIAVRRPVVDGRPWNWQWTSDRSSLCASDAEVADWTPLAPAPAAVLPLGGYEIPVRVDPSLAPSAWRVEPAPATVDRDTLVELAYVAVDWTGLVTVSLPEAGKQVWEFRAHEVTRRVVGALADAGFLAAPSPVSEDQEQRGDVVMLPARWETQIRQVMHQSESLDAEDRTDNVVEVVMSWPRVPSPDGDLVDRVAQAIWHANCAAAGLEPDEANRDRWLAHWTTEARAAITAMQEVPRG